MKLRLGRAAWGLFCRFAGLWTSGAEPELRQAEVPHFPALEPAQALASFELHPGFRLEFAAHEPEVVDPIALSFDEAGRAYVVEMRDYSERRPERLGRVRRLEDRDGDGYFETSVVFLEDLPWPTAVTCWKGGVFVGATPEILFAQDTNGDGRADVREVVFTGFASDSAPFATNQLNVQAMMNSLQWGLDCRIHGSASLSGGKVRRVDNAFTRAWTAAASRGATLRQDRQDEVNLRGRDFSFDPRTLEIQAEAGGGQHGMSFDDSGRKFLCSNSDHLQLVRYPDHYSARSTWHRLPLPRVSIAADGPAAEVFRLSPEEPWRIIRTRWRVTGLVSGLIEGGGRASGYFTGATGVTIYRGDADGADIAGDAFVADCGSNLVHRKKLRAEGCELIAERPAEEQTREFLASRDTWFRPVQFANAPDGCLWVIDMYREIIEHPWSLPANLKRLLDLNAGNDRGRIYRIAPRGTVPRRSVDLTRATTAELIALLGHPNGWHRDTAARLLCERQDPGAVAMLERALRGSTNALMRLHSLHVLKSLGGLEEPTLAQALADPSPIVRRHAVRLTEIHFANRELSPSFVPLLAQRVDDEPWVRLQLALALGQIHHPECQALLARLIRQADTTKGESLIVDAALAASDEGTLELFRSLANPLADSEYSTAVPALAEMIGRRNRPAEIASVLDVLTREPVPRTAVKIAARLAEGLREARGTLAAADRAAPLARLLALAQAAAGDPANAQGSVLQLDAIRLLASFPPSEAGDSLRLVLDKTTSAPAQRLAIEALLRMNESRGFDDILDRWPRVAAEARSGCLELVLRRPTGPARVLDAIGSGRVRARDLGAAEAVLLRHHSDPDVRRRAIELLGAAAASRNEALAAVLPALDLTGNPHRGTTVYLAQCSPCHRLAGQGFQVGPDLESIRSQPREKLLVAIMDPNREVAPNYLATTVETKDHETCSGVLADDDASGLTLRQASGLETRIPRNQILEVRAEGRSLMPEGFETTLSRQDLADLLARLTAPDPSHRPP